MKKLFHKISQNKNKIVILIILLIISLFFIRFYGRAIFNKLQNQTTLINYNEEVAKEEKNIGYAIFDELPSFIYEPDTKLSFLENSEKYHLNYAINGSYFESDNTHAGLLVINDVVIKDLKAEDLQLSHVVVFDYSLNKTRFLSKEEYQNETNINRLGITSFQTGPIVIDKNNIQEDFINNSINGKGSYLRTLYGYTESGKHFFLATRVPITLKDVAEYILEIPELKGEIVTAINLDGGPSTAFYSKTNGLLIESQTKLLPIIFGVK